jgi:hypothetical protein
VVKKVAISKNRLDFLYRRGNIFTMTADARKYRRVELEKLIFDSQAELGKLKSECNHELIAKGRFTYSFRESKAVQTYNPRKLQLGEPWESVHMYCQICDKDFGWYCPKNPKGYCEYYCEAGGYGEECVFCHKPDERK